MKLAKSVFQSQECLKQDEILHYLEGASDDESRYRVENHLLDCPLCSSAMEGLVSHNTDDLAQELDHLKDSVIARIAEKHPQMPSVERSDLWTFNRIAAAILLLVVSAAGFFYWSSQNEQKGLLAMTDSPAEITEGLRSAELLSESDEYGEGLNQFRQGDYEESLVYFESLIDEQAENSFARFYTGLSALQIGELDKAVNQLSIVRLNSNTYYEHATYYLALTYLRQGQKKEAKGLLKDLLKKEGGFYSEKAKELLEKMD